MPFSIPINKMSPYENRVTFHDVYEYLINCSLERMADMEDVQ